MSVGIRESSGRQDLSVANHIGTSDPKNVTQHKIIDCLGVRQISVPTVSRKDVSFCVAANRTSNSLFCSYRGIGDVRFRGCGMNPLSVQIRMSNGSPID
jgi:hypothetical protein